VQRCRVIDKKYTLEQSSVLYWRGILLSDSINPERRLWWTGKDIGAENDLLNDLGFNLCVVPWSLVVSVTNFIWPYLHQFFIDSHGLNGYGKPLKRPFD